MQKFYNDLVTAISGMSTLMKIVLISVLGIIDILLIVNIVKSYINTSKKKIKIFDFILLAITIAITVFVIAHV